MTQSYYDPEEIPAPAAWLGYAGLIPFVALAAAAWVVSGAGRPWLDNALLTYGAVILSFMGAVHWGLAMRERGTVDGRQLLASVVPPLVAWFAAFAPASINYPVLIVAFALLCLFDGRMARVGKAPAWYPKLRTPLTAVVVLSLISAQLAGIVR